MADRLNDTDPQSPRALGSKTDPGLGDAPAIVALQTSGSPVPPEVTPSPGSASIEELIDGITGPRPPPSSRPSRRSGPRPAAAMSDSARAYVAARAVPTPRPMPPVEPSVLSPEPPLYSGVGRAAHDLEVPRKVGLESTRPVMRRPAEERTVHTGRRALVRNLAAVVASSAAVAVMMTTIMRWKEAHRPHALSEVVVLPAVPDQVAAGAQVSAPAAEEAAAAVAPLQAAPAQVETAPVEAPAAPSLATVPEAPPAPRIAKPAGAAQRRGRAAAKGAESLDDLNRQIRH